ncbi:DUF1521 domain-containing protein [Photobacterium sp. J15]|uniref:DUF1521 domain-containing protein n=1 Tax=Photobacterium sp. J15 TaxID=265901 RepID=UPI0007E33B98|nr:DUF1521 domain-containing protein [Photobacterium sp. J15]
MNTVNSLAGTQSVNMYAGDQKPELNDLMMAVMIERTSILDGQIRDGISTINGQNEKMRQLQEFTAEARQAQQSTNIVENPTWSVEGNQIKLDNGYVVTVGNENRDWTITDAAGNTTKIWGDPHVDENGDGTDWDFKQNVTFALDDGTKISVGTAERGYANTVTDSLAITKGNQHIQVTGIADNNPTISQPKLDGLEVDAATNDGTVFYANGSTNSWFTDKESQNRVTSNQAMGSQQVINEDDTIGNNSVKMSAEMRTFLEDNNIEIPDNKDGYLSKDDWKNLLSSMQSFGDSLTSVSQLDMAKLQSSMNKYNQSYDMLSNFTSKYASSIDSLVGNLR